MATRIKLPVTVTPFGRTGTHRVGIYVFGAGGIGARLVPLLPKLLRPGDLIHVIDPDQVEPRNLLRQHFETRDLGLNKAEVMQLRYNTPDIHVEGFNMDAETYLNTEYGHNIDYRIFVSGVDTKRARQQVKVGYNSGFPPIAWIDVGNETREGQVLLWSNAICQPRDPKCTEDSLLLCGETALPQVYQGDDPAENTSCAMRIDVQTATVNNMGAALAANLVAAWINGIPINACGWFFSTYNAITPIPLVRDDHYESYVRSSTMYAKQEGEE